MDLQNSIVAIAATFALVAFGILALQRALSTALRRRRRRIDNVEEMRDVLESVLLTERNNNQVLNEINQWLQRIESQLQNLNAKKMSENGKQSGAYALGMIQGIKATLLKFKENIDEKDPVTGGKLIVEFSKLMNAVNEFPVIQENGRYIIEPNEGYPTFQWIQEQRDKIVNEIIGE